MAAKKKPASKTPPAPKPKPKSKSTGVSQTASTRKETARKRNLMAKVDAQMAKANAKLPEWQKLVAIRSDKKGNVIESMYEYSLATQENMKKALGKRK